MLAKASDIPWIIEFVGLPGAGKSTVSAEVIRRLCSSGIPTISRSQILDQWRSTNLCIRLLQLIPYRINHWEVLLRSLVFAIRVYPINQWSLLQSLKVFVNVRRNDAVANSSKSDQLIVLDQGAIQELWSVGIAGSPPDFAALNRSIAPILENRRLAIVYCKADIDTALARINLRQQKHDCRFDVMELTKARASLMRYFPYLKEAVHYGQHVGVPILEIDSACEIEQQSKQILNWIKTQLDIPNKIHQTETVYSTQGMKSNI